MRAPTYTHVRIISKRNSRQAPRCTQAMRRRRVEKKGTEGDKKGDGSRRRRIAEERRGEREEKNAVSVQRKRGRGLE